MHCLTELRWLYDRRDGTEARQHLAAWLERWQAKYPKLTTWAEEQIEETFTFYRLPQTQHPHLKSTNLLEIVGRIFNPSLAAPRRRNALTPVDASR